MLEDQVAYLLQRYLGNYVRGLSKEALKISVWKGDVELKNMQLKPEALNALKLPIKVKAGFLGSVKLKVPWSRLGQDPVLVYLDRIFLLAEPATTVEGCTEDAVQEAKRSRIRDMEIKLVEKAQHLEVEVNQSWLGSLINTIIGNLKLSISNVHIRYEDNESNPGHPFAAGVTMGKLSAFTIDDDGKETFATGGALDRILKSVELESLALYFDSDISPWHIDKTWEDLLPSEWSQVFTYGAMKSNTTSTLQPMHSYILQPVSGRAKYLKQQPQESSVENQPSQKAAVFLDDVTICLSKDGYRDIMKLADNFAGFNKRLKYAHHRPSVPVNTDPKLWWKYAYRAVTDQFKKSSGKMSWEHVLRYARLRKRYISLYASLLKSDPSRIVDDNKEIQELDHELDIELIVQWRMVAHKFVQKTVQSGLMKQRSKKSWWPFGWSTNSNEDDGEGMSFSETDWEQLNRIIGYKEGVEGQLVEAEKIKDVIHTSIDVYMRRNASKLMNAKVCLAELSCEGFSSSVRLYPEAKVFDVKLGSYRLNSPNGLLAESATAQDSLVGSFWYKPFNMEVDWSMVAKASPCYVTYLKDSVDEIMKFFDNNDAISQKIALDAAAAVQTTIDEVKRNAQQQMNRALKDQSRFFLDLDIAAPKITIPADFQPDSIHFTKLMLDLGNLIICTKDDHNLESSKEKKLYMKFDLVLSDVSAFLVDGDYDWSKYSLAGPSKSRSIRFWPVIDRCGVVINLEQMRVESQGHPSTRLALRVPSLAFHFSPARYHRLMHIFKEFIEEDRNTFEALRPWMQADFEGWLSLLTWKGVGNREAVWQQRYLCLVGPFLYILESPDSKSYKQCISLRGKHVYKVPAESIGYEEHVLTVCESGRPNNKVVEDANALVLQCDSDELKKVWLSRLRGAVYLASGSAPITTLSESSSDAESDTEMIARDGAAAVGKTEKVFITGILEELKICFYTVQQHECSYVKALLSEEKRLLEFRAIGGRVEISIRDNDMFIGTVLKSLEIEDLVSGLASRRCYLARSFIRGPDDSSFVDDHLIQSSGSTDLTGETEDKFYEAPENLTDLECMSTPVSAPSEVSLLKAPSFSRVPGLLPDDGVPSANIKMDYTDELDSFVKAQIVLYDQNSPLYNSIDKRVAVTLATLSFYCRRPMVLAIMEFGNFITIEDDSSETLSESSSAATAQPDLSTETSDAKMLRPTTSEPVVKGLMGKGKSRIVFCLTLNMARAQILLLKEDESKLATLSQDNLLTDIKVYPASFSIKASLGNLRISDDSLPNNHMYYWACDMRNPGGSSFVELLFCSYGIYDDDYEGYEYSLCGQLSEVRVIYLNRFIQEVVGYFTGLVPETPKSVVKLKDQVTDSEKWFTESEIAGSPALKLDLSLSKPIILMPRKTDSLDYLKLDVVHITIQNTFQWFGGTKADINAVHLDILTVLVEDINLNCGTGSELGETIIQDVNGVSIVVQRALRDLLHQVPNIEAKVEIGLLKASLSNKEYQIITDCAQSNISETPNVVPPLRYDAIASTNCAIDPATATDIDIVVTESSNVGEWISMKVRVVINLVELSLHTGAARDVPLATMQVSNAWLLYKSTANGNGFLSATLKSLNVLDDREGTEAQFRLAVGRPKSSGYGMLQIDNESQQMINADVPTEFDTDMAPTMLIVDMKLTPSSTSISLCIQRPQLLVALDFLLAVAEFFVPTVRGMISSEEEEATSDLFDAIILEKSIYKQPSSEFSLSPHQPLIVDDKRYNHFIYDGNGGKLFLKDRKGSNLCAPSTEALIYVGNGKKLQFKNVTIQDGQFLDSCVVLGTDSSYLASEHDKVYFINRNEHGIVDCCSAGAESNPANDIQTEKSVEYVVELQAIGPELTFFNISKDVGNSPILSNKLLHAQFDVFSRVVLKGDTMELSANALGFTMESNGIRILEPFDTSVKFSRVSGKTNIHLSVSDVFLNFSFSILRLFIAVEEDMLAFMRTSSRKLTISCYEFDKVGMIEGDADQVFVFWRPRAPPGFAVLGDYLTPTDKPPTKGVHALNMNLVRVKRPVSFKLVWPVMEGTSSIEGKNGAVCSVWFPVAPQGYVAMGCVVSQGMKQPGLSSTFCIQAALVCPSSLRDCIQITSSKYQTKIAFWRVDNSLGTFLPANTTENYMEGSYALRHIFFGEISPEVSDYNNAQTSPPVGNTVSVIGNSGRRFEAVASFQLVWWNQGSSSRKKISIWRPIIPPGMIYFGDVAVQGYEPPNTCIVLQDRGEEFFKKPVDFELVGQIKKHRGTESVSYWLPQAPPGFVTLGCIACKGSPKNHDFSSLRCIRNDMVVGDKFLEESLWDTSDAKVRSQAFSLWSVGNELGTFMIRNGDKKPPKRFAMKLADQSIKGGPDDTVIDADINTFSVALFDDFGGLMVPLCNVSFCGIGFSFHGRSDFFSSTVGFFFTVRSYNDKYEAWEPVIEPVDGFLRYQYDLNTPGAAAQLRLTFTRSLNLNVSISNANMILQAYASWNTLSEVHKSFSLSQAHESFISKEAISPADDGSSIINIHHKRNYYIIPQNKLGQDIFIRAGEIKGFPRIIKMPSGDMKPLKVPVSKNMMDSHLRGNAGRKIRTMVTFSVAEAQFPRVEGLSSHQFSVAIRLVPDPSQSNMTMLTQQSARTSGSSSAYSTTANLESVKWNEVFFFKVDSPDIYLVELMVTDLGKGNPVGFFSAPLMQIAVEGVLSLSTSLNEFKWIELSSPEPANMNGVTSKKPHGRLQLAVFLSPRFETGETQQSLAGARKSGFIQISPTTDGPWTAVRLNYAAPAACWRLGSDVVASEVHMKDGNRYVNIRSLVSVRNNTDFSLELCLKPKSLVESGGQIAGKAENFPIYGQTEETEEYFETQKFEAHDGWVHLAHHEDHTVAEMSKQPLKDMSEAELEPGWEWIDEWHVDRTAVNSKDGWAYAPNYERLKWPESCDTGSSDGSVRQRRWIRSRRKRSSDSEQQISIGLLKPGDTIPLPLSCLIHNGLNLLRLRPINIGLPDEYSWSTVVGKPAESLHLGQPESLGICVSALEESDNLLYCAQNIGTSSIGSRGMWFCLNIQATEVAKDIHSNPIQDWALVVKSPLSIANYLPLKSEYSVLERQPGGHMSGCSRGIFSSGKLVNVYSADITKPLYLSLFPQKGWLPTHEAVPISHPHGAPGMPFCLRSSLSGRIVRVILEQSDDKERPLRPKTVRVYAPFWLSIARCPALRLRLIDRGSIKEGQRLSTPFRPKKKNDEILEEISEEEFLEGHTIASALNFKTLGLSVSVACPGEDMFGPVTDLSPLCDMDGSVVLSANAADGNCMRLFISSKPCPHQSIPTKVVSLRPYMTFTNRVGEDIFIKLGTEDEPKILRASDSRVALLHRLTDTPDKLQVCLEATGWSYPVEIKNEDTISLVLRDRNHNRRHLRTEIRGYEEGSRFIVVFRLGSSKGPIRFENRTDKKHISIRQSGFNNDYWIQLPPLSSTNFSWENPYGPKFIDVQVQSGDASSFSKLSLETATVCSLDGDVDMHAWVVEAADMKICRFIDDNALRSYSQTEARSLVTLGNWGVTRIRKKTEEAASPLELIIEFGVVGVSVVDHRPKELSYLYLERVYMSYSSGYDGGTTSRFKIILGHLQLDNQLPLALLPVLLAPEEATDVHHPAFKMTLTMRNENTDGVQVFPYVYIRVTEKVWRLNIHEPIIWAFMNFYQNLQLDRLPQSSNAMQVDPELRIDLIDVSEVRLKVSFETAPAERPFGVLGVWSPLLSAIGNAFKFQVHLRKVMHKGRFMRKSSVAPAITNRIWRDLIHNPLHLIFSVDVLGMASSTLASLSKGFAELSTDGQFLQLRSKQVWSRRITGVGDGFLQGTEALAQGFAFGVTGMVRKPVESARENGILGLANGLGRAFLGFIVQPVSGAFDFLSLTVDGIGASCARCFEVLHNRSSLQRVRNPRAIRSNGILLEYNEREAVGQMILHLAEASHHLGCTDIFKEPSKFAFSDYYEEHYILPHQNIALVTNKRVMLLQCLAPHKMDKRPCKILWDIPWEELLALELVKAGNPQPCRLILHLKNCKKSEVFARVIKCNSDEDPDTGEVQAVKICSLVRNMWRAYQSSEKSVILKVPSSQRYVHLSWNEADGRAVKLRNKSIITSRELSSSSFGSTDRRFVGYTMNFIKIWSSEPEPKTRCTLCKKKASSDGGICSIWRPACPLGYVSIGDVAHVGSHPPNVAAVYRFNEQQFSLPMGYDLVWRNCRDDYRSSVSIWLPRAPDGYVALGCVAVADFSEPERSLVYCVAESLVEQAEFEAQKVWVSPDSYPWACHVYQVQSDALHFVALRLPKEECDYRPQRVLEHLAKTMSASSSDA